MSLSSTTTTTAAEDTPVCGLYLAPSKHDPQRTWGLYAGTNMPSTAKVQGDSNDDDDEDDDDDFLRNVVGQSSYSGINLHHFRAHNTDLYGDDPEESEFLLYQAQHVMAYSWSADKGGASEEMAPYVDRETGQVIAPEDDSDDAAMMLINGPASLAAFDTKPTLTNVDFDVLEAYQRTSTERDDGTVGMAHPNRGAVTPFHNVMLKSTKMILAGDEIVIRYVDPNDPDAANQQGWMSSSVDVHGLSAQEYAKIDETIDQMLDFFGNHDQDLDPAAKQQIYNFLTHDFMDAAVGESKAQRVVSLFPASPEELASVKQAGGIRMYNAGNGNMNSAKIKWLQEEGYCADNLRSGKSTIPNAGHGAFAVRSIGKDQVVTPVPLIHIPDKVALDMYPLEMNDEEELARNEESLMLGQQLLTNYVFGHPESTMVFFPTGPHATLINHADDPSQVNAKLQWADTETNEAWMKIPPYEFIKNDDFYKIGLLMEIVATRDIAEGEEIFIDYGKEWKEAWDKHVE